MAEDAARTKNWKRWGPYLAERPWATIREDYYFFASWLGMIPGTVLYVYIGSLAGDLATLGAGGRTRTSGEWILYGIGLLATIAVTVFVTRLARRALAERIHPKEHAND